MFVEPQILRLSICEKASRVCLFVNFFPTILLLFWTEVSDFEILFKFQPKKKNAKN